MPLVLPDFSLTLTHRACSRAPGSTPYTKLLLLGAPPLPSGAVDVLDLGCGYGPIAVTLAGRAPDVWGAGGRDAQLLGTRGAHGQCRGCWRGRPGARTLAHEVPGEVRFAAIWSNPPIAHRKLLLDDLLRRWLGRLDAAADVQAVLVVKSTGRRLAGPRPRQRGLVHPPHRQPGRLPPARGRRRHRSPTPIPPPGAAGPMKQLGSTDLKRLHRDRAVQPRPARPRPRPAAKPSNVGAILPTAAAMRVDHVPFVADTPTPETSKVGKTALGAEHYLTAHVSTPMAPRRWRWLSHRGLPGGLPGAGRRRDGGPRSCRSPAARALWWATRTAASPPPRPDACDAVGFVPQLSARSGR